jgi:hypothetical protein
MGLVTKVDPVGEDFTIDRIQRYLWDTLVLSNWQSYHRAYKNPKHQQRGFIAEVYTGDGEYGKDAYFDDNFDTVSFFLTDERIQYTPGELNLVRASWIAQLRLSPSYPGLAHRPDAEFKNDVMKALKNYPGKVMSNFEAITGIPNVYRGFDFNSLRFDDMSDVHVLRVDFDLRFNETCCTNC